MRRSTATILLLSTERVKRRSVGSQVIATALHVCEEFLGVLEHSDIDVAVETPPSVKEQQWAEFLQDYYNVVQ